MSGRVQGVWFRGSMEQAALCEGVTGWVENLPDGRVAAVVEGEPAAVSRMIEWCRHGPSGARVDEVDVADEPPQGTTGFRVRY